ncbi:submandibular gland secretory Glx-rich protein CA-like [Anopheles aquasalis]|uniref:submandibular gland secretory Glx-rich protein CA-like n=1 Tax=Anopheles aquasalis TaxID=42839 RepID=UPI00215B4B3D|nr:submandibular gland secretory Glx-rich protein CA-like [Anopheles aquasalis]
MHRSVIVVLLLSATIALSMASPRRIHTGSEVAAPTQTATPTVPEVTAAPNAEADDSTTPEQELLAIGEAATDDEEEEEDEEAVVPAAADRKNVVEAENAAKKDEPTVAEAQEPTKTNDDVPLAAAEEVEVVKPLSSNAKTADYAEEPQAEQSALKEIVNMLAECYKKAASFVSSAVETVSH